MIMDNYYTTSQALEFRLKYSLQDIRRYRDDEKAWATFCKGEKGIYLLCFRPYGESLDSPHSPFGPACGCYSAALRFSLLARKRK